MRLLFAGALGLLTVAMVACHALTEDDAQRALGVAESAANVVGAEKRMRDLYAGCGVIDSCAAGCSSAMGETIDDSQRAMLIARCSKDYEKAQAANPKLTVDLWFQGYFDRYLVRAREKLPSVDQARLDLARKKLSLSK
jgi:hypothetical protein